MHLVSNAATKMAEKLTPVLQSSKFLESGMLTPVEFKEAGDFLVYHCPTWQWKSGDPSKAKSYLDEKKQFLVTRNVPCYKRCRHMEYDENQEKVVYLNENDETNENERNQSEEDAWVDTHHYQSDKGFQTEADKAAENIEKDEPQPIDNNQNNDDDDDDEDLGADADDMEAYMDEVDSKVLVDEKISDLVENKDEKDEVTTSQSTNEKEENKTTMSLRTYDLNITYDNYYRTPRMWLTGYDENRQPLTPDQMYEDISQDHVKRTVTYENHPHLKGSPPSLSIHPCRHADVMKKLIGMAEESGKKLEPKNYMVIFLKFIQAVVPTIEYDFTRNFKF
ncbi:hypothetical protein SNEBB_002113 [Seison nebaliae]|nr:hypothetical protein SNEBB_002113 [Seison nebaliae]